jgi:HEAT repeat protein
VPPLLEALSKDSSEEVRSVAVLSLERFGIEAARSGATLALLGALNDTHWKVRANAACALPDMGEDAVVGLSALAVALRDETPYVRGCAADAKGEIGTGARDLAHELEPLLSDVDDHVRHRAARVYKRLPVAK